MFLIKEIEFVKKNENEYYMLNLTNGALDIIENALYENILNNCEGVSDDILAILKDRKYVFDNEEDYDSYIKQLDEKIHDAENNSYPNFLLIPSYNCNLNCIYCYEHTYEFSEKNKERDLNLVDIQYKIINEVVEKYGIDKNEYAKVRITIMGGEPLLVPNKDVVKKIIDKATEVGYTIDIVTNGVDLDKFIDIIKNDTVKNIQITIDGTKEIHDQRRIFYDKRGSFDIIFKNLKLALETGIEVYLRLNADDSNIDNISDLSNLLKTKLGEFDNLHPYIYLLQDGGCSGEKNVLNESIGLNRIYEIQNNNENAKMFYIKSHVYPMINSIKNNEAFIPRLKHCGASGRQFILDEKLLVYKCWHGIGSKKFSVGYYDEDGLHLDEKLTAAWDNRDASCMIACRDCKYRYLCGTGCPAATHKASDMMNTALPFCPSFKELFEVSLPHYFN